MGGDPAHPRADREGHLDHLVERRFVSGGAQRAAVFGAVHGFERRAGVEDAAAAGAEHVPGQLEEAEPRRVQEGRDDALLVETVPGRERQRVRPVERMVRRLPDELLDRGHRRLVGGAP